jgi:hypothetical protein
LSIARYSGSFSSLFLGYGLQATLENISSSLGSYSKIGSTQEVYSEERTWLWNITIVLFVAWALKKQASIFSLNAPLVVLVGTILESNGT